MKNIFAFFQIWFQQFPAFVLHLFQTEFSFQFRAYKITNEWFGKGKKVSELETYLCKNDKRLFVERIRQRGVVKDVNPNLILHKNDEVVLSGRREFVIGEEDWIGPEVIDAQLLDFPAETLPVMVTGQ